jgi:deoxyhypusine synthase
MGLTHYRYDPSKSDRELFHQGYNRIYDTLEMEANLNDVARLVSSVLDELSQQEMTWSSMTFCRAIGKKLSEAAEGPGILRSAFEHNVPVYIPAFTDSEMGLDMATWAMTRGMRSDAARSKDPNAWKFLELSRNVPPFNPFLDLQDYARRASSAERLGILTVGGGVPRNWAQQVAPFIDITNNRLGTDFRVPRFQYGVRICPEPVHWGGLSGCTYSEGVSWGKFVAPADGGRFAEIYADATIVLPLLVRGLIESMS